MACDIFLGRLNFRVGKLVKLAKMFYVISFGCELSNVMGKFVPFRELAKRGERVKMTALNSNNESSNFVKDVVQINCIYIQTNYYRYYDTSAMEVNA